MLKMTNLVVTTETTSVSKDVEFINTSVDLSAGCHYSNTDDKVISLINSDDCIPSTMKKLKLDVETILMGEKLSNLHINAAQKILKIQFPAINGLESTLYQMKEKDLTEDSTRNKLQIVHCAERHHWIVTSNIGCEEKNTVKVYDSIFYSVDTETRKIIINLFQTSDIKIDIN